jgi:excinuclease ABC subunit B
MLYSTRFLRSKRSLIQTIGRVARHQEGTAILYARGVTESMRMAIEETERRRKYQQDYNQKNGIIPASIIKKTDWDLLPEFSKNIIEKNAIYSVDEIDRKIASLRLQMKNSAKLLDFDHATKMRNEIQSLEKVRMLL